MEKEKKPEDVFDVPSEEEMRRTGRQFWKKWFSREVNRLTPAQTILLSFLAEILLGTFLLMLPISTREAGGASFLDALFTSTSATCVTGLIVRDTACYWSGFGQLVILLLIQIGGMGVVTMAVILTALSGKRIGFKQRWFLQESISAPQVGGIMAQLRFIVKGVLLIEGTGAVLLALRFCPEYGWKGLWMAVFHSVSAFCNAGFDVCGSPDAPFVSVTHFMNDPIVVIILVLLIVIGGIGFFVWKDVIDFGKDFRKYRLQSRLALTVTALLLVFPFLFYYFYEFSLPQWSDLSLGDRFLAALFQTVTPRTAGFNTVDLANMSGLGITVMIFLMLTGGSPGSTAGGFKTTTLAVAFLNMRAVFQRRGSSQVFGRRIPAEAVSSASALLLLYVLLFVGGGLLISAWDNVPVLTALFESASAVGTAGLTLGITVTLSVPSRLLLILLMYIGRVGGLTLIYGVVKERPDSSRYPQEQVTVG